jgi:hypothetical protein
MRRRRLLSEQLIGLPELAKRIRSHRHKGAISAQTTWRWATSGVELPDGRTVKLETVRLAGRFLTSWPAFERFVLAQSTHALKRKKAAHA